MNKRNNYSVVGVLMLMVCGILGCGGPKPAVLVSVTGIVKIDGEPTANIMVIFAPKTIDENIDAPTSQALTDSEGRFVLFTTSKYKEGAIVGPHLVTLLDTEEERPGEGEVKTRLPRLDVSFFSNGIDVEIVEGKEVVIEATSPR